MKRNWLIWSIEHRAWWAPYSHGYTNSRRDAGRYTFDEAREIVRDANHGLKDTKAPNEAMIEDNTDNESSEPIPSI